MMAKAKQATGKKPAKIETAMILGAGFGTRMAPLTDTKPKPLVPLCGKPLIDWPIDRLAAAGVTRFVVNTHYLPEQMAAHFKGRDDVALTHESEIQETGGGVRDALDKIGAKPFFVTSSDAIWFDGIKPAVQRMLDAWDPEKMDALLLLVPVTDSYGYDGPGDYYLEPDARAVHRGDRLVAPYLFGGLQILKPALFADAPEGPFPLRIIYNKVQETGRLYAVTHDGEWYHVGTPESLKEVEEVIAAGYSKANTR
ncbi:nucleotidyltransferase family protein [Hwanghaeella sp.]|uniref:nucleotidyltransferase family protein n=1 Tax=Hwanghaeella sp. TaxID=2605943 RepID=UPI003CCB78C6